MKPEELKQVMEHYLSQVLEEVKSVSCDMSPSYKKLCKRHFSKYTVSDRQVPCHQTSLRCAATGTQTTQNPIY
ncbi:MAG: transposase [Sphingobacteriales bacterium]|nr:transposase [Sphingobacteriales bacterium]